MAKKFVRGVTGVDDIEKFDKSLTNVNDLISDGKATYVHTKQGKNEKYVNITDKITSITSGYTGLLDVSMTGDNKATLTPKHDSQKEQVVESTRNTITIEHGANGTSETTKVDTNPEKVLEHENLLTDYGISKTKSGNTTTLKVSDNFVDVVNAKQNALMAGAGINLNNNTISLIHTPESTVDCNNIVTTQYVKPGYNSTNLPTGTEPYGILTVVRIADVVEQTYQDFFKSSGRYIRTAYNLNTSPVWNAWKKIVTEPAS